MSMTDELKAKEELHQRMVAEVKRTALNLFEGTVGIHTHEYDLMEKIFKEVSDDILLPILLDYLED